jgi:hypothetical protein
MEPQFGCRRKSAFSLQHPILRERLSRCFEGQKDCARKPDCVRDEITQLFDDPRRELFARSRHSGFDLWGDEVEHFSGTR